MTWGRGFAWCGRSRAWYSTIRFMTLNKGAGVHREDEWDVESIMANHAESGRVGLDDMATCDAAIIDRNSWINHRTFGQDQYCEGGVAPKVALPDYIHIHIIYIYICTCTCM